MAVSVHLDFVPPNVPDLTDLKIYESASKDGPWALIETVTPVGSFGAYLSSYTTDVATSTSNWFAVEWVDSKGAVSQRSNAVQGSTLSLVAEITDRVLLRDPTIPEQVALEETEAAIEGYYGVDPYTVDRTQVSYTVKSGLTFLALARSYISTLVQTVAGSADSYTAGLVAQSSGSSSATSVDWKLIDGLVRQANALLGKSFSTIMLLKDIEVAGISAPSTNGFTTDLTRAQVVNYG